MFNIIIQCVINEISQLMEKGKKKKQQQQQFAVSPNDRIQKSSFFILFFFIELAIALCSTRAFIIKVNQFWHAIYAVCSMHSSAMYIG